MNPNLPVGKSSISSENSSLPDGSPQVVLVDRTSPNQHQRLTGTRLWAHRFGMLLFVFFCAVLGVVLVIFPWREEWTSNSLLVGYPALQEFLSKGFVRGLCSGLGLLDIWIGFSEAIHYHE